MVSARLAQSLCRGVYREATLWKALTGVEATCSSCRWFQRSVKELSTSARFSGAAGELHKPLKQWTLIVNSYSTVKVQLPCNVSVRPLDPHSFPEADRAFITVNGTSADQGLKLDNFHVKYNEKRKELFITSEKISSNMSVEVTAPINCDLDIKTLGEGNVKIQKMECENCTILTERGHSILHSIKGHTVHVHSKGGNVICLGTIYGNIDVSTSKNSLVDIAKLQGTRMRISTEHGAVKAKHIYAESSVVSSVSGKIELGNVHGNISVQSESGDIIVDGSDGYLNALVKDGDIDAYISQFGTADIESQQGAVSVRVPSSIKTNILLSGAVVDVSPEILLEEVYQSCEDGHTKLTACINGKADKNGWIKAHAAKGTVSLRSQSWVESLKIGKS
ncbi:protein FAM185A [Erpetoichthys calabaricus]|uniref:Family with sequence similarity 185 member A n=1 Tax=Erpetoichthys calabaricus TaxID=27687 RepID=A0A8C4RRT9_ERPCA|nr:protein FAM185A [Erpetoichthys calabaricus]